MLTSGISLSNASSKAGMPGRALYMYNRSNMSRRKLSHALLHFGQPVNRAQNQVFDAGLFGVWRRDRVAVTTQTGRQPEDMRFSDVRRTPAQCRRGYRHVCPPLFTIASDRRALSLI